MTTIKERQAEKVQNGTNSNKKKIEHQNPQTFSTEPQNSRVRTKNRRNQNAHFDHDSKWEREVTR